MRTKPDPQTAAFGIDIGKKVFHAVALNAAGAVIQRAKFSRDTLLAFFDAAPDALIGMEACPGSQWLARRLATMGHDARIIPARFVKPYVKLNKTDTVDAAAVAEAVTRPRCALSRFAHPSRSICKPSIASATGSSASGRL